MAKKDKVYIPTGMAGLVRYGEERKDQIKLKPEHVIYFSFALIIAELILRFLG